MERESEMSLFLPKFCSCTEASFKEQELLFGETQVFLEKRKLGPYPASSSHAIRNHLARTHQSGTEHVAQTDACCNAAVMRQMEQPVFFFIPLP